MLKQLSLLHVFAVLLLVGGAHYAWPQAPLSGNMTIDKILVDKSDRSLVVMSKGRTLKSYRISLGGEPRGAKSRQGDEKTPEGLYSIDYRKANSDFHRALHISYPNEADMATATQSGDDPGGAIMIHGLPNGYGWIGRYHRLVDWTQGCIALTNTEMDELWSAVPDGTILEIQS